MTQDPRPKTAKELAGRADHYKTTFVGLQLALIPLLHPNGYIEAALRHMGTDPGSPLEVDRADGTTASSMPINYWLERARQNNGVGFGLRDDTLAFAAMFIVTRLEDDLQQLGLRNPHSPALEFLRHIRNAAAHGNRWHFRGQEPRNPAKLRNIELDPSLHDAPAYNGTVGPGDFLDLLDDVRDELLALP
jgi:hypothetical protein